eukprot:TRINITY_DN3427_c0_g1_i3.p1 TRINITY_DN3427_c0_g1~~TRINITY_DN3427_c0_g1_i3.p1  ORF type:complete len:516 (+),score=123.55 TRINITY_DN3427_c0_g1_i3:86-1633(+)
MRVCILEVAHGHGVEKIANAECPPVYPHDAKEAVQELYPDAVVETVFFAPDARKAVAQLERLRRRFDVFINLYDLCDETGQKIVDYLEKFGVPFTGAGSRFYDPSRETLKLICRYNKVNTPMYAMLVDVDGIDTLADELGGFPLFIKPQHGYDSVGIDANSVVQTVDQLRSQATRIIDDWGCALVEKYVDGREFSVLVVGDKDHVEVFHPVEYVFPAERQPTVDNPLATAFITHEDKWVSYANRWRKVEEKEECVAQLMEMSRTLFVAFEGQGLARFDIRQDRHTGQMYVLDINPNPSMFYVDGCTADTILSFCGLPKSHLMNLLIQHAQRRSQAHRQHNAVASRYRPGKGFSLHATRDLSEGELIYTDEMNSLRVVTKSYVDAHWKPSEMHNFDAYAWPLGPNTYAIWDEDPAKWKPINHSCNPNCWMQGLEVRARRAIASGEELTLDYSTFLPWHPVFDCWCGADTCRGCIRPHDYLKPEFLATYDGHCSPFIQDLIDAHKRKQLAESEPSQH